MFFHAQLNCFSRSTQLSMKFILLINVKMPTIVDILTFISKINTTSESFNKSSTNVTLYSRLLRQWGIAFKIRKDEHSFLCLTHHPV